MIGHPCRSPRGLRRSPTGIAVRLIAVLTLTSGRDAKLANLVGGLDAGKRAPDVLVVADMAGDARIPPARRFRVEVLPLVSADELPLARARILAAEATGAERLIFLA